MAVMSAHTYVHAHVHTFYLRMYVQYPSISTVVRHASYSTYVPNCKCMFVSCMSCVHMYYCWLVSQMWYSPHTGTIPKCQSQCDGKTSLAICCITHTVYVRTPFHSALG